MLAFADMRARGKQHEKCSIARIADGPIQNEQKRDRYLSPAEPLGPPTNEHKRNTRGGRSADSALLVQPVLEHSLRMLPPACASSATPRSERHCRQWQRRSDLAGKPLLACSLPPVIGGVGDASQKYVERSFIGLNICFLHQRECMRPRRGACRFDRYVAQRHLNYVAQRHPDYVAQRHPRPFHTDRKTCDIREHMPSPRHRVGIAAVASV
jgi:hypothetical protein